MKKILAIVLSLSLLTVLASGLMINAAAFDENTDYVTFTATGDDPYAVFNYGGSGVHQSIDPDTVTWCAIRYRTNTEFDTDGMPLRGQLYIMPFLEPYISVEYNFTDEWETAVIDCTEVNEDTELESKWNSSFYTTLNQIRFDPLESSRNAETDYGNVDAPAVAAGSSIDIAWICFFENEADARAYTGIEDTPYCVLGPGALSKMKDPNMNLSVERIRDPEGKYNVSAASGYAGETVDVTVAVKTNPGIAKLNFRVTFDNDVLELVDYEDRGVLNGFVPNNSVKMSPFDFLWDDTASGRDNNTNGKVVKLTFKIKDGTAPGEYAVTADNILAVNSSGKEIKFKSNTSNITVLEPASNVLLGDVDDDGEITDWDAILFDRYLAGWSVEILEDRLDIDSDGEISDWDAITLSRYLAGWNVGL